MLLSYRSPISNAFQSLLDDKSFWGLDTFDNLTSQSSKISSTDENYIIKIAVPGLTKEDIKITSKEEVITVLYEKNENNEQSFVKPFKKTYSIPSDVDEKKIEGKIENGIIEIILPKNKKKAIERLISLN